MDSARLGTPVSKRRKRSDGTSQNTSRAASVPMSSIFRGECDSTRVLQVI